ncbi:hypothetical protein [Butyrivibrio sp. VCD2006]|uniref:hypothetical protein n=1 Tax=Butyrivibrio sp. VCD2006 TaxID=1280664 RepID=UPI0003FFA697|nr:hypothetical protein [Butyrivibrio sp. VCD2006]
MKKWNAPNIQELNLSSTMLRGRNPKYVDGYVYDAERDTNWASYSGGTSDPSATGAEVIINNP